MPNDAAKPDLASLPAHSKRGEIHLGDLAVALSRIPGASAAEQEMIAQCLGFQLQIAATPAATRYQPVKAAWNRPLLKRQTPATGQTPRYSPFLSMPPAPDTIAANTDEIVEVGLQVESAPIPQLDAGTEILIRSSGLLSPANKTLPPPRLSLFGKATARGVVSAAVTRHAPGWELDIPKLIQATVQQKPLVKLPVLPQSTARNGCQLLLDFNDALMPWWEDMQSLIRQFQQVLGEALCPVYEFSQQPLQAVRWTEIAEIRFQPVPGKPVIIASDLGVIQPPLGQRLRPGKADWLDFIQACKIQNTPVAILFPLDPRRCPYGLDKLATLIHWHPATSAAEIKRLISRKNNRL